MSIGVTVYNLPTMCLVHSVHSADGACYYKFYHSSSSNSNDDRTVMTVVGMRNLGGF